MSASPIYDEAWWQRRSESHAAARTLLGIREALEKGASLGDVAGACGLTDPPAVLGLDDVEAELAHRMERAS